MNTYCLKVTSAEGNELAISSCVRSDDGCIVILVDNLAWNTSYIFYIISKNNIGQQSTAGISLCKEIFNSVIKKIAIRGL